ncbi:anti-sigma factor domain-containing protein [Caldalkalibacillus mannanilyticus]|uniref:anti-sigma factor domain-containing protein n=1 Tax=Caldalkalibacillus mannanilyticus TaxID=1418 RepID=UPI00046AE4E5|nr:anti-sigma factor domain-containing protein [Caldalkalibacillus mannanilyticus]
MNKGIVLEIKGEEVVVLTKQGEFRSIKKESEHWQIGDEITLTEQPLKKTFKKSSWSISPLALAASVLLLVATVLALMNLNQPEHEIAFVYVDINPSVEMSVNEDMEVIRLRGTNKEGEEMIRLLDHQSYHSVEEAAVQIILLAQNQGYLTLNHDVLISTAFIDQEKEKQYKETFDMLLNDLEYAMLFSADLGSEGDELATKEVVQVQAAQSDEVANMVDLSTNEHEEIKIHRVKVNPEDQRKAREIGVSPGKYTLFLEAKHSGSDIELNDLSKKSVSQIAEKLGGMDSLISSINARNHSDHKNNKGNTKSTEKKTNSKEKEEKKNKDSKEQKEKKDSKEKDKKDSKVNEKKESKENQGKKSPKNNHEHKRKKRKYKRKSNQGNNSKNHSNHPSKDKKEDHQPSLEYFLEQKLKTMTKESGQEIRLKSHKNEVDKKNGKDKGQNKGHQNEKRDKETKNNGQKDHEKKKNQEKEKQGNHHKDHEKNNGKSKHDQNEKKKHQEEPKRNKKEKDNQS